MKNFLFDMDGTLLPMDLDQFGYYYFGALKKWFASHGLDPDVYFDAMMKSVGAIYQGDGSCTNAQNYWRTFTAMTGMGEEEGNALLNAVYESEFVAAKRTTYESPDMIESIRVLQRAGVTPILTTNAIFPLTAIAVRLSWAGLSTDDFSYVTTLDNSHYVKPNPKYFTEVVEKFNLDPAETVVIGNDLSDDAAAKGAGLTLVLVTDWIVNGDKPNVADYTVRASELPALLERLLNENQG